jgi:hypothetical protein
MSYKFIITDKQIPIKSNQGKYLLQKYIRQVLEINEIDFEYFTQKYKINPFFLYEITEFVNNKYEQIKQNETNITELLIEIESKTPNVKLFSLNTNLKTKNSIIEKILLKSNPKTIEEVNLDNINDIIRYTFIINTNEYIKKTHFIFNLLVNELKFNVLNMNKVQNRWDYGDGYQGINIILVRGTLKFELQFHTPESIEIKEKFHNEYKQFNKLECTWNKLNEENKLCEKLRELLLQNEHNIPNPFLCYPDGCPPMKPGEGLLRGTFPDTIEKFQL